VEGSAAGAGEKSRPPPVPAPTMGGGGSKYGEGRRRSFVLPRIDMPPELLLCSSTGPCATGRAAQDGAAMSPWKRMGRGRRGGAEGRDSPGRWRSAPPLLSGARRRAADKGSKVRHVFCLYTAPYPLSPGYPRRRRALAGGAGAPVVALASLRPWMRRIHPCFFALRPAARRESHRPLPSRGSSLGGPPPPARGRRHPSPREARRSSDRRARWIHSPHATASVPREGRGASVTALVGARIL
jgi:hypothetical protein